MNPQKYIIFLSKCRLLINNRKQMKLGYI